MYEYTRISYEVHERRRRREREAIAERAVRGVHASRRRRRRTRLSDALHYLRPLQRERVAG
jgi:hypothetical protein